MSLSLWHLQRFLALYPCQICQIMQLLSKGQQDFSSQLHEVNVRMLITPNKHCVIIHSAELMYKLEGLFLKSMCLHTKQFIKMGDNSKILLFLPERAEQFTFSTVRRAACSCFWQPQATGWLPEGLAGDSEKERKMSGRFPPPDAVCRTTPGFRHVTCQCSHPFISKAMLVGLGQGIGVRHSQAQIVCIFFFLSLFLYPKISTLSLICCYAARNCPSTVYMYSLLFWTVWI